MYTPIGLAKLLLPMSFTMSALLFAALIASRSACKGSIPRASTPASSIHEL